VTSQKSIVTVRLDWIESAPCCCGALIVAGGAAPPSARGVPQAAQNFAESGSSAPQFEHDAESPAPQLAQNFAPEADSAPQCGQNAMRQV